MSLQLSFFPRGIYSSTNIPYLQYVSIFCIYVFYIKYLYTRTCSIQNFSLALCFSKRFTPPLVYPSLAAFTLAPSRHAYKSNFSFRTTFAMFFANFQLSTQFSYNKTNNYHLHNSRRNVALLTRPPLRLLRSSSFGCY